MCGLYYGESIRYLDEKSGEHICVLPLIGKKVKPSNNKPVSNHVRFYPLLSILAHENKKYLLEIKEGLQIMRDKPSLNRNINSGP